MFFKAFISLVLWMSKKQMSPSTINRTHSQLPNSCLNTQTEKKENCDDNYGGYNSRINQHGLKDCLLRLFA